MIKNSNPPDYGTLGFNEYSNEMEMAEPVTVVEEETCGQQARRLAKKNLLVILLIIALVVGIALGMGLRQLDPPLNSREAMYLRFPGEILMNMLQLLILPLIVSSLISGLTSLDTRASGKLGARAILYYLTTTLLAVILGIILVMTIRPGKRGSSPNDTGGFEKNVEPADTFLDLIRQMFPDNIVEACFRKTLTELQEVETKDTSEPANGSLAGNTSMLANESLVANVTKAKKYEPVLHDVNGINMLGLVVFSVAMGVAINRVGEKGRPVKEFIESLCEVTLQLVSAVIWYSPVGVLFLVAAQIVKMDDLAESFERLGFYFITVVVGLIIHGFIVLPLIYFVFVRKNPYKYILGMLQALVTALGTSSSSATLPVTMRNLEENNGVDPRVIAFVAPVGATINMDGTALYEAVAVIFIGQVRGFEMSVGNVITVCLTATAAAIGAAGVPQAGLVTMVIVLTAVGFPTEDVAMILAIDWLLDRIRTMINVLGDAIGAGIVHHYSKADMEKMDEEDRLRQGEDSEDYSTTDMSDGKLNGPDSNHVKPSNGGIDNEAFSNSRL